MYCQRNGLLKEKWSVRTADLGTSRPHPCVGCTIFVKGRDEWIQMYNAPLTDPEVSILQLFPSCEGLPPTFIQ
ncbi:atp dependent rna [Moniliophthora roreri]|nr:atp dependent rna [Moniliophthora roreri]